jgi:SAM-dependent methyltransferase
MSVFGKYADFYDLYYARKDYAAETRFVLNLARRFGCRPRTVLDMGCGTGRHLEEFLKRGLTCDGFDRSEKMLSQARDRLAGRAVGLAQGDLTGFENGRTYDLVISMFAVMGYLTANDDLMAGLATARKHLRPGGLFIFDGWFGPAVLAQKPESRCHAYRDGGRTVTRRVSARLDPVRQRVNLRYDVVVQRGRRVLKTVRETHRMRFMFVQEMALALASAGLDLLHACPFMEPGGRLTTDTWNVTFVAAKRTISDKGWPINEAQRRKDG